ncbi:pinopsin-like [Acropora muricata]|uniref:pinopsin-like n=1 Tax=Acropora muricata TaxID=159855 RepID=UPI0034E3EFBC
MANHSQQQNITISFPLFSSSQCIAWLSMFGMEAVAIVTLNALTIIVYLKERSLRKRSMYLVINQAVADMLVAGCVSIHFSDLGSDCKFWTSINSSNLPSEIVAYVWLHFIPVGSITNLAAISLERMHATFRPFKHRLVKKKMFGGAVAAVWITAGLCSAIDVLVVFYPFTNKLRIGLLNVLDFTYFLFCLLIILVSYSSIAIKIIYGNQPHHHGASSREKKLTKTLFIVTVVSLLLTQPFITFWILHSSHTFTVISPRTWFRLSYSILFLFWANSLVNPVCYAFRIPAFKRALFFFLLCTFQPQQEQVFPLNEM